MANGLTRRSLLRGLGATAAVLPALELTTESSAKAQDDEPKRFVVMYGGISAGRDGSGDTHHLRPGRTGAGYDLPRSMAALGTGAIGYGERDRGYGVQDEVSVVSGLKIPWGPDGAIPPGGKSVHFHYNTAEPQMSGVRRGPNRSAGVGGTSVDLVVADAIGDGTIHRSLSYRVQAARYITGSNSSGGGLDALTTRRADGRTRGIDAVVSPRLAYESLFSGFIPPDSGRDEAIARMTQRRGILSALRTRTSSIRSRLGRFDQLRLQQHFDELRELESRLSMVPEPGMGACTVPMSPGTDPAIADGHRTRENGNLLYTPGVGYSQETLRGNTMVDLAKMAMTCDLTRSVAMRISLDQTFINAQDPVGGASDMHQMTHGGATAEAFQDTLGWHVAFFARMVAGLRDTMALDGSSLLDHTNVVLFFEGGYGFDPESGNSQKAHSTENMVMLVGGRLGGVNGGIHISATDMHPSQVFTSLLPGYGLPRTLGEMSGSIPGIVG